MKIVLDPGHSDKDTGARYRQLNEKDIVLDVCLAAYERLCLYHWIVMTRTDDSPRSLLDRTQIANWWKADLFVSVHCNADPDADRPGDPEAKGEEIWVYPDSPKSRAVAYAMEDHVNEFFPQHKFRGIKESGRLYVLRATTMPAVLVEIGFLDNTAEHGALSKYEQRRRIGRLLARGLLNYDKGVTHPS